MRKWIHASRTNILIVYFSKELIDELYTDLEASAKRGVTVDIILILGDNLKKTKRTKKRFNIRTGDEKNPKHGNFLVDKKYCLNVFESDKGLNAVFIQYSKCVLCINAWLNRFLERL